MQQRVGLNRRIRFLILGAFAIAAGIVLFHGGRSVGASALGPAPTFTNAPGEGNCTACHNSFTVNSGGGNVQLSGVPANYRLGQTVTVTVTVTMQNQVVYGFESTALDGSGRNGGSISLVTTNPMQTQLKDGIVGPNTRTYVEHTVDGILPTQFGTKSWQYTWHAPTTPRGNITLYAAGNAANSDGSTGGDYIYTTSATMNACSGMPDFDGDCKSDVSVFRPSNGGWYISRSSDSGFQGVAFGAAGDVITPGDFDGDGKTDIAVFRPSNGAWYVLKSSNGAFGANIFGQSGDVPVVGDFDGDQKSDLAVFRPSDGTWYITRSSNGQFFAQQFGANGDSPVPGDYDGDGKSDVAVFRPSTGSWYILQSSNGQFQGTAFGSAGDKPVEGDYDGDGRTDLAVWRPSNGAWYKLLSSTSAFSYQVFGLSTDQPAPADFDGDGKTDIAVLRDGSWYIFNSSDNSFRALVFGTAGDLPVQKGLIGQ